MFTGTCFVRSGNNPGNPVRLNKRHKAIIEHQAAIFHGATVLDLGAHDGRWMFAALRAGACKVIGIEGRAALVAAAHRNLRLEGLTPEQYELIQGDITRLVPELKVRCDVIMCLGVLYHVLDCFRLLADIVSLRPKHIIIDTAVTPSPQPLAILKLEDASSISSGLSDRPQALVSIPSQSAIQLILEHGGYRVDSYDWHSASGQDWEGCQDYRDHGRVTMYATLA